MAPFGPVKINHKKDGHQRRPHRFHVSWPPSHLTAGSATENVAILASKVFENFPSANKVSSLQWDLISQCL